MYSRGSIDYTYINARIHGLISKLLTEEDFAGMDRTGSVQEVLHILRSTRYSTLADIYTTTGDIKLVELELQNDHRRVFQDLRKHSPEQLYPIIDAFAAGLDYQVLKESIRLWFDQSIRKRSISDFISYIPHTTSWHGVTPSAIINASSMDGLLAVIRKTRLQEHIPALEEELQQVSDSRSLFYLELTIDRGYCMGLTDAAAQLRGVDRTIEEQLIAEEIDARNGTRVLRYPTLFSQIPAQWSRGEAEAHVQRVLIPGGELLKLPEVSTVVIRALEQRTGMVTRTPSPGAEGSQEINALGGIMHLMSRAPHLHLDAETIERLSSGREGRQKSRIELLLQIDAHIRRHQIERARAFKRGDPFTIGTMSAYLILKEREIDRVRSMINAKYYGLKFSDITAGDQT
ncbi:MAG: V-type ATPase subunit [Spirochaetia bacterium]|nr:V-type ATPase subunit [Spirochaetia bacterium]